MRDCIRLAAVLFISALVAGPAAIACTDALAMDSRGCHEPESSCAEPQPVTPCASDHPGSESTMDCCALGGGTPQPSAQMPLRPDASPEEAVTVSPASSPPWPPALYAASVERLPDRERYTLFSCLLI